MRVAYISLSLLFALSGCSEMAFVPAEVKIPIAQSCNVKMPEKPDYNFPKVLPSAPLAEKVKAMLADIELYKGYTGELEAAVRGCQS